MAWTDDLEAAYQELVHAYPADRRVGGKGARKSFAAAVAGKDLQKQLGVMLKALENHKASQQWNEGYVPLLTTWLNQERWIQVLPARVRRGSQADDWDGLMTAQQFRNKMGIVRG